MIFITISFDFVQWFWIGSLYLHHFVVSTYKNKDVLFKYCSMYLYMKQKEYVRIEGSHAPFSLPIPMGQKRDTWKKS